MATSSNKKRALLNQQCREALSAHIENRLGIVIKPDKVRLQPPAEDGYAWSVTEESAWLLQSCLSSGKVGLYRAICNALGKSLEAVRPGDLPSSQPRQNSRAELLQSSEDDDGSFTARIRELESTNDDLAAELERVNNRLEESLSKGRDLQTENQRLRNELRDSVNRVGDLGRELHHIKAGITEAMKVLQNCPSLRSEEKITPHIPDDDGSVRADSDQTGDRTEAAEAFPNLAESYTG
ncbi:hypothetical protein POX_c04601 [Penicillium oxalicum]|uniref:hypothetical protein n=1 Tax=Penicillium oxalicum TaxID=69781 RepID=UPI0020B811EA|nr:hypothetical protein POX_c04601 [Penicillium oxalicum]KAI2791725.1 hypothetical protein POX_c04601 [Penicillium oxalicum]